MELTLSVKKHAKIPLFLKLLNEFENIEIVDIKEDEQLLPQEHRKLLDERLKRIENGETTFRDWDLIKKKYEKETV